MTESNRTMLTLFGLLAACPWPLVSQLALPTPDDNETAWVRHIAEETGWDDEERTPTGARIDLLTPNYAIEVDWCKSGKVYEAVGQALYYQAISNRRGAVLLLMGRDPAKQEIIHYHRCLVACCEADLVLIAYDVRTGEYNPTTKLREP